MPMTKPLTPALEALVTEIGEDDIHFFDYYDLHDVEDPTQKRTVEFLAKNADKVLWTWVTPSYDGIPTTFYCALSEEELAKIFKGIIIGESGGCNSDECTCCGTVTVSFTTSSCNGFIFHAYGYNTELADLVQACDHFNSNGVAAERGGDGTVTISKNADETLKFWSDRFLEVYTDLDALEAVIREDGDVIHCRANDLADYLRSTQRQNDALMPEEIGC